MPLIFFYYKLQIWRKTLFGLSVSVYENVAVKAKVCNTMYVYYVTLNANNVAKVK